MAVDFKMTRDIEGIYDFTISETGDFETEDSFDTAILYSLLGERRAADSEVQRPNLRRGWIGNEFNEYENGSKLWLFYGARVDRDTLNGVQNEGLNGLEWMITDGVATNVTAEGTLSGGTVGLTIDIVRPSSEVERRFIDLWDNTGLQ